LNELGSLFDRHGNPDEPIWFNCTIITPGIWLSVIDCIPRAFGLIYVPSWA